MADPLSISSGIAGLLSLGIQVTQSLIDFYMAYKDQDTDLAKMTHNFGDLQGIFRSLKTAVQESRFGTYAQEILHEVNKTTQRCQEAIKDLQTECEKCVASSATGLKGRVQVAGRRAAYPFRKSTLLRLQEDVGEIRDNLLLAMNVLHLRKGNQIQSDMSELRLLIQRTSMNQMPSTIPGWFMAPDSSIDHYAASKKRHPGTGLWFLSSHQFATWIVKSNSFLWINGFAGCGKSVLCSTAIQHIFDQMKQIGSVGIAYFYFLSTMNRNRMNMACYMLCYHNYRGRIQRVKQSCNICMRNINRRRLQ